MAKHTVAMICRLCGENIHPLDAHMGRINDTLDVFHIDCWNKYWKEKKP